jgi:hypothetical protein
MMKKIFLVLCAVAMVGFMASGALATSTTVTTLSYDPSSKVKFDYGNLTFNNSYAGVFTFALGSPYNQQTKGYCIEVTQHTSFNDLRTYQVVDISTLTGSAKIAGAAEAYIVKQNYTGATAAAAQVAVWELAFDVAAGKSFDLTQDKFRNVSGTNLDLTLANSIGTAALAANFNPTGYFQLTNSERQDFVTGVPIPGAVLLLGAGMARLAAYARRRRNDQA